MEKSIYYEVELCENDRPDGYYKYCRNWNVKNIAGYECADGYIVQEVHVQNTIGVSNLFEDYYEAWRVIDGICLKGKNPDVPDDTFLWDEFGYSKKAVLGKNGEISYQSSVYWVDRKDPQFYIPDGWEEYGVGMAGELKAVLIKNCPEFQRRKKIFDNRFVHRVDFDDDKVIKDTLISNYYSGAAKCNMTLKEYLGQFLEGTAYAGILEEIPNLSD